jgi:hypothetical protein
LEVTYILWENNMEKGSICAGVTVSQSNWQKEKLRKGKLRSLPLHLPGRKWTDL